MIRLRLSASTNHEDNVRENKKDKKDNKDNKKNAGSAYKRRLRRSVARTRRIFRRVWYSPFVTLVLVVVVALSVLNIERDRDEKRKAWGTVVPVAVATRFLEEGSIVHRSDVVLRSWPTAVVPAVALRDPSAAIGRAVRHRIDEGQMLTPTALGQDHQRALITRTGSGRVAVAVPLSAARPKLQIGDHVDVVSVVAEIPGSQASLDDPVSTLEVVGVEDDVVTLAVKPDQAQSIVALLANGPVTVLLHGR